MQHLVREGLRSARSRVILCPRLPRSLSPPRVHTDAHHSSSLPRRRFLLLYRPSLPPHTLHSARTAMGAGASVDGPSAEEEAQRRNTIPMVRGKGGNVNPLDSLAPFSLQRSVNVEIKLRKGESRLRVAAAVCCCDERTEACRSTISPLAEARSCAGASVAGWMARDPASAHRRRFCPPRAGP